jgi:hypothetical protein
MGKRQEIDSRGHDDGIDNTESVKIIRSQAKPRTRAYDTRCVVVLADTSEVEISKAPRYKPAHI